MRDTRFTPDTADRALRRRIAPTATDTARGGVLRGTVHDGNAWALGGVSGHAGLFSTARDLAVFAELLLRGGRYGGARVLAPHTVARWTARQGRGRAARWAGTRRRRGRAPGATSRRAASGTRGSPARRCGSTRSAGCSS
jgi:CubicO group peptidase (beta-lactamase class C family)